MHLIARARCCVSRGLSVRRPLAGSGLGRVIVDMLVFQRMFQLTFQMFGPFPQMGYSLSPRNTAVTDTLIVPTCRKCRFKLYELKNDCVQSPGKPFSSMNSSKVTLVTRPVRYWLGKSMQQIGDKALMSFQALLTLPGTARKRQ